MCTTAPPNNRRVAVVTGGNKGVGYGIAMAMAAKFDGVVYLTSRDETRGRKAIEDLNKLGLYPEYHQLDIDDESSVLKLRDFLVSKHGGLDVLVNNACIIFPMSTPKEEYADSVRKTIQTNYYNMVRVCDILFPILRAHARVVHLTSDDGHLTKIAGKEPEASRLRNRFSAPDLTLEQLNELMQEFIDGAEKGDYYERGWPDCVKEREPFWPNEGYMVSKVGISAITGIQQRQFNENPVRQDISVNCVHPGYVDTDATQHMGVLTIQQGADAPAWLAMMPPSIPENPTLKGSYIWHDRQVVDWVNGPLPSIY